MPNNDRTSNRHNRCTTIVLYEMVQDSAMWTTHSSHTPINCCFHMIEWDSSFNNIWHVLLFFTNSTYVEYGTTYWDKIGRFYYLPKYGMIYACYHFKNIWRVLLLFTHITYLEYGTTNCDRIRKFHYLPVCIIVLRRG